MKSLCYIALGSNLANPKLQIKHAVEHLKHIEATNIISISPLYLSKPWGKLDQPDFINAVASLETTLPPLKLMHALQEIEKKMGREKIERNGPRIIDLDIIFYDDIILNDENLTLPHPRYQNRAFVLLPLFTIAPHFMLPGGRLLREHIATLDISALIRIEET